jgi:hypothetical protein
MNTNDPKHTELYNGKFGNHDLYKARAKQTIVKLKGGGTQGMTIIEAWNYYTENIGDATFKKQIIMNAIREGIGRVDTDVDWSEVDEVLQYTPRRTYLGNHAPVELKTVLEATDVICINNYELQVIDHVAAYMRSGATGDIAMKLVIKTYNKDYEGSISSINMEPEKGSELDIRTLMDAA